jgi:hypothetical protein
MKDHLPGIETEIRDALKIYFREVVDDALRVASLLRTPS